MVDYTMSKTAPLWLHCWWYLRQQEIFLELTEQDEILAMEQYKMMLEQEQAIKNSLAIEQIDTFINEMKWPHF